MVAPPPAKTFEGNCAGCHFTGYTTWQDEGTGEWLADAVFDPNGAFDIDNDGTLDEINTGCEKCHGPGSEHIAANVAMGATTKYIVAPSKLTPSRELMICGICHDRSQGNGSLKNDHLLNDGDMGPERELYYREIVARSGTCQIAPANDSAGSHEARLPGSASRRRARR